LPSRRSPYVWLLHKEWRALLASRAWWFTLAATGPIVGVVFSQSVRTFAEISEGAGSGCGAVCDPLVGIWGPTFGAFELISLFLLPFVVIRVVAGDRLTGAHKIEDQHRFSPLKRLSAKLVILTLACVMAGLAAVVAIALWRSYGGAVSVTEIAVITAGHLLNAALTIALAASMASMTSHPSTAAVLTLGFTVTTWIVQFAAAIHGGFWNSLARLTPSALVATFQRGLVDLQVIAIAIGLCALGLALAVIWQPFGTPIAQRLRYTGSVVAIGVAFLAAVSFWRAPSWDLSDARLNSFPITTERDLRQIDVPVRIDVRFAAEDPRRIDLERHAFAKLRRTVPTVDIVYHARTSTGLFEMSDANYGELTYSAGGRAITSRITTEDGVLDGVFAATGVTPSTGEDPLYYGDPLVASPKGAAFAFYVTWPAAVVAAALLVTRRRKRRLTVPVYGGS
jgi:ABC-2 type transport system permease protein